MRGATSSPERVRRVFSKVRKGRVIAESPRAGAQLDWGSAVNLTVSRGRLAVTQSVRVETNDLDRMAVEVRDLVAALPEPKPSVGQDACELGVRVSERILRPDIEPDSSAPIEVRIRASKGDDVVPIEIRGVV